MKEVNTSDFIVTNPVNLNEIPTTLETGKSKKEKKKALKKVGKKLAKLQYTDITEPPPDDNLLKNIKYKEILSNKEV